MSTKNAYINKKRKYQQKTHISTKNAYINKKNILGKRTNTNDLLIFLNLVDFQSTGKFVAEKGTT